MTLVKILQKNDALAMSSTDGRVDTVLVLHNATRVDSDPIRAQKPDILQSDQGLSDRMGSLK